MKRFRVHRITTADYVTIEDISTEPIRTFSELAEAKEFAASSDPLVASLAYGVVVVDDALGVIDWGNETTDYRGNQVR